MDTASSIDALPVADAGPALRARYERFLQHVERARLEAREGKLKLAPDGLWLAITENCNFKCVGCYTEGLFKKTYLSPGELERMLEGGEHKFGYISLTEGEAFLHPQLCDIIELCKAHHPEAKIDLVTNASVAIRGRYRKAVSLIDSLGVSIDGAKKETYESIRRGGNFERFLVNAKDIVELQKETGKPETIEFSFTAMTSNIGELPGVVRIAAELGIRNVYAQPMEMRDAEIIARVGEFHISLMPQEEVYEITDRAKSAGRELGVAVYGGGALFRPAAPAIAPEHLAAENEMAVRMCQYPWHKPFQFVRAESGFHVLPCCYMLKSDAAKVAERYGLHFEAPRPVLEVYNSAGYWRLRTDLAEGKLGDLCGGCLQAKTFPWRGK